MGNWGEVPPNKDILVDNDDDNSENDDDDDDDQHQTRKSRSWLSLFLA